MAYANATNISTIPGLFQYSNTVSDGVFGHGLLISLFFIVLLQLLGRFEEFTDAVIVAGFFTTGTSFLLRFFNVVNDWDVWICITVTVVFIALSYWNKDY